MHSSKIGASKQLQIAKVALGIVIGIAVTLSNAPLWVVTIAVCLLVMADSFVLWSKDAYFTTYFFFAFVYAYVYGITAYLDRQTLGFNGPFILSLIVWSEILFFSGYNISFVIGKWPPPRFTLRTNRRRSSTGPIEVLLISVFAFGLTVLGYVHLPLGSALRAISLYGLAFVQVISVYLLHRKRTLPRFIVFAVILFISFLGGKVLVLRFVIVAILVINYHHRRISMGRLLIFFLIAVFLFGAYNYIQFQKKGASLGGNTANLIGRVLFADNDALDSFRRLLSHQWSQYASYGTTYLAGLIKFLPRQFFPFKPYGANGVLNTTVFSNYVYNGNTRAASVVVEAFINWNVAGISVLFVMGWFSAAVDRWFHSSTLTIGRTLLFAANYLTVFSLVRDDFNVAVGFWIPYFATALLLYAYENHIKNWHRLPLGRDVP